MSLHCLVKYLCSENYHAREVIEANCHQPSIAIFQIAASFLAFIFHKVV